MFHQLLAPLAATAIQFRQPLQPVADSLFLSFLIGIIPIIVVLILLGILRRPAWQAALAGLIVGFLIAITVWGMPIGLATSATFNGFAFALWPVMWIVWNAMWLFNITVRTGKFDMFRRWMVHNVPADRRILMLVIGFSFGALMEGIAGFGTPVAITSALLIALGFPVLDALVITLMFNTAPVAFGALGAPIVTLSGVTNLSTTPLSAMVGRQLPVLALLLPFYALVVVSGTRGLRTAWPAALVAGLSFALTQFIVSNFVGPQLPDVLASLVSLVCTILFVRVWQPRDVEEYRVQPAGAGVSVAAGTSAGATASSSGGAGGAGGSVDAPSIGERNVPAPQGVDLGAVPTTGEAVLAWLPWLLVSLVVILWITLKVNTNAVHNYSWPGLDKSIFLTAYNKPYAAVFKWDMLGTGTAILVSVILTALLLRATPAIVLGALGDTWRQLRFAILTVVLIVGLAYLYNYSGLAYTVGLALAAVGSIFPFFSAFLGWIACFLSGSDTSSNALFGNLQVVAARKLHLSPVLMAATNSSGAVTSKMISPQNVTTGVSTTALNGKEGLVIRRTFVHSIILAAAIGVIALIEQYLIPGVIPH